MKKFTENDILISTLKVYPKVKIFSNNGNVYYNNTSRPGPELNVFLQPFNPEDILITTESGDILTTESAFILIIEE